MSHLSVKHLGWMLIGIAGVLAIAFFVGSMFLPGQYQIGTEVVIPRSPEATWNWFVHPKNWNRRFSVVQRVEESSNIESQIGEQLQIETRIPGGNKLISNIVVTDWIKGRLVGDRHQGDWLYDRPLPLINVKDRFEFRPEGLGKTRVLFKETFDVNGPLDKWIAFLVVKPAADRFLAEILNEYHQAIHQNHKTAVRQG